jgi:hypothetical protein
VTTTASALRRNIYKLLDQVIETGIPLEVERKGVKVKISSLASQDKLKGIKKRNILKTDPENLVHLDWSGEWKS